MRAARSLAGSRIKGPALLAAALLTAALAPGEERSAVNLKEGKFIQRGKEVYARTCAVGYCHGTEGRASGAPALRDRPWTPRAVFEITRDGVSGTAMPAWKDLLSEEEIWAVTAYILSLSPTEIPDAEARIEGSSPEPESRQLSRKAQRGRELFFDLTNQKRCSVCHAAGQRGNAIGPNLAAAAGSSVEELVRDIVQPGESVAKGFEQTVVTTRSGETVAGILEERTEQFIRLYDMGAIPPPLRTIYPDQIRSVEKRAKSSMPEGYAEIFSREELEALAAYIRSAR